MAIKSISQLEEFDNGAASNQTSPMSIGKNLAMFLSNLLTSADVECAKAEGWPNELSAKFNDSFYESLFEISQPTNKGPHTDSTEYLSKKVKYSELVKNIIWDVKAYLNWRHALSDYSIYNIVDGNQIFHGNKTFDGNLSVTYNLYGKFLSALTANINALSVDREYAKILSADDLSTNTLTVNNKVHFNNGVKVIESDNTDGVFLSGYAYGLKNDVNTKITVPSSNKQTSDVGDPVWFYDGQPKALSCVNCATSAYNLISSDGSVYNVGTARLLTDQPSYLCTYTVVKFENGKPVECNEIDFAHHAWWSDLGERYLADKEYEPGTLVKFGGTKEITIADDEVNAIVSTKAFDLNAGLKDGTVIALCGRVPTKVKGKIQKFDKIMLSNVPGIACKWDGYSKVIGRALESNDIEDVKLVECVTRFSL